MCVAATKRLVAHTCEVKRANVLDRCVATSLRVAHVIVMANRERHARIDWRHLGEVVRHNALNCRSAIHPSHTTMLPTSARVPGAALHQINHVIENAEVGRDCPQAALKRLAHHLTASVNQLEKLWRRPDFVQRRANQNVAINHGDTIILRDEESQ